MTVSLSSIVTTSPSSSETVAVSSGTVTPSSNVTTQAYRPSAGATTSVTGSTTAGTILASNANRIGASLYNESASAVYVLLGAGTASSTTYTLSVGSSAYFEVPFNFTGIVTGAWVTSTGFARVTEYTS